MNLISKAVMCVFALLLFLPIAEMTQTDCELRKDKDGIKVYSCPTKESSFNDIWVEFEVNSTIEKYISIVLDIDNYKTWRYQELNHRLLSRISDRELIYYNEVDAPFPVSNRDLVSHLTISQDETTKILTVIVESMPDYIPPVDDVVRVPRSRSVLTFTPMGDSKLKGNCFIAVDPGGKIPAWVSNTFGTLAPYEVFKNLIKKMETE